MQELEHEGSTATPRCFGAAVGAPVKKRCSSMWRWLCFGHNICCNIYLTFRMPMPVSFYTQASQDVQPAKVAKRLQAWAKWSLEDM